MAIKGNDNRFVVTNEEINIFDSAVASVVAIDRLRSTGTERPGVGSGIVIGPNHVLTAGHVLFPKQDDGSILYKSYGARVTAAEDVPDLEPRLITPISGDTRNTKSYNASSPEDLSRILPSYLLPLRSGRRCYC